MPTITSELVLDDSDLPLLTPTVITQQFIEKDSQLIPFSKLVQLNVALDALQPTPPNTTTVWFDNTILLQDALMTSQSLTINSTSINSSGNITIDPSNELTISSRTRQNLNTNPSWNAVNGYYGLAKDAYPALNPTSNAVLQAVSNWTERPSVNDGLQWRGIAWSPQLRRFVCSVSSSTTFQYSSDGINWTATSIPSAGLNQFQQIVWSPELNLFVCGNNGNTGTNGGNFFGYSSDGITWNITTSANMPIYINQFISLVYSPQLVRFVATGSSNTGLPTLLYSNDGINWTLGNTADNFKNWRAVAWSPELGIFTAISSRTNTTTFTTSIIMTSTDGINWINRGNAPQNANWTGMVWSPELGIFVVVSDCFLSGSSQVSRIMTSVDGINWIERTNPATNAQWFGLVWSPQLKLFVSVATGNNPASPTTNRIMSSPDGINWTLRQEPNSNGWVGICWSPELGIFVGSALSGGINRMMTSSLAGRPPTSYNVFDSSFNNIDSSGNWSFKAKMLENTGDITIDPSNTLIVLGNLDMSSNDIQNVNSLELDNGTNEISINPSTGFTITDNVSNITNLTLNSLSFNDGIYTSSIGMVANDYVVDANGARLLMNGGDAEFYIGQYSASTAPCIISGGSGGLYLNMNSRGGTASMGDCDNAFNSTKITIDDGAYRVNTNAVMMTAYNNSYILPICYTHKMSSGINYIGVNNTWQNVYQDNMNALPNEFFNSNNTFWDYKIEFSINMRNVSSPTDKGLALYFEILDGNSAVYTPFLYNQNTPFTRHSLGSTYNATSSDMLTFTWTDTISFNNSVVPVLTFSLWWYGDDNNAPDFDAVVSLTRTNLV